MANANFSIGMVGITGHLLVNARTVANPTVIEQSQDFPGPQPSVRNLTWTGLSPEITYFDFRETSGTGLGVLLSTFTFDVVNNRVVYEKRFYTAGGPQTYDPTPGTSQIIDPYLDGKNVVGVFKEGFRFLKIPDEYTLIAGGGIQLENYGTTPRPTFADQEVYSIDIDYSMSFSDAAPGNPLLKVTEVTADVTLGNAQKNGRVRLNGALTRLTIGLPAVSTLSEGDYYHFTTHNGNQINTKFFCSGSDQAMFNGTQVQFMALGKGEFMWIEKRGLGWEVILHHPGLQQVGERFAGTDLTHSNTLPEDGRLIDGNDYPRLNMWLTTQSSNLVLYISEAALISSSFVPTAGREGCFFHSNSSTKFRMPNTQGWSERGIKDFDNYNTDLLRPYDYPGGTQPGQVGAFDGNVNIPREGTSIDQTGVGRLTTGSSVNEPGDLNIRMIWQQGKENITKNTGVIYLRRT